MRAIICRATACCSRRSARCSACACSVRLACSPRRRCSSASCAPSTATLARWGAAGSRWRPWATCGWGGSPSRWACRWRWPRCCALRRQRTLRWRWCSAAVCAAASPVAGALLGLAAVSRGRSRARTPRALLDAGSSRRRRRAGARAAVPGRGFEPYPMLSFAATAVVVLRCSCGRCRRASALLRIGAWIYLLACVACLLVHSPVGSNVERYGVLLAGPLLLCAALGAREPTATVRASPWRCALCAARCGCCGARCARRSRSAVAKRRSAAYYAPVERFIAAAAAPVRVEVPLTRSHWEAALLAPSVSLARGWEKQLDSATTACCSPRASARPPTSAGCMSRRWPTWRCPTRALDPSSAQEGRLIRARPALPARGLREQALARLRGARADPAGPGPGAADGARPRLLHAARARAGQLRGAGALHALLDDRARAGLRGARLPAAGRGEGRRAGTRGRRRALLARAGLGIGSTAARGAASL